MKTLKSVLLVGAAAMAAALLVGASSNGPAASEATHKGITVAGGDGARPASVPSEKWIALSDKAGFVLTTERRGSVGAELYLKTESGWVRGRLENPATLMPVTR